MDSPTGIVSPTPTQRVVVSPPSFDGIRYTNQIAPASTVIDNLDQCMLIALYRLTRWINSSSPDVTELLHLGIGHGGPNPKDCHNQGRALDLSGIVGELDGVAFTRLVQRDWGDLPRTPGKFRIDPATDPSRTGCSRRPSAAPRSSARPPPSARPTSGPCPRSAAPAS